MSTVTPSTSTTNPKIGATTMTTELHPTNNRRNLQAGALRPLLRDLAAAGCGDLLAEPEELLARADNIRAAAGHHAADARADRDSLAQLAADDAITLEHAVERHTELAAWLPTGEQQAPGQAIADEAARLLEQRGITALREVADAIHAELSERASTAVTRAAEAAKQLPELRELTLNRVHDDLARQLNGGHPPAIASVTANSYQHDARQSAAWAECIAASEQFRRAHDLGYRLVQIGHGPTMRGAGTPDRLATQPSTSLRVALAKVPEPLQLAVCHNSGLAPGYYPNGATSQQDEQPSGVLDRFSRTLKAAVGK